MHRQMCGLNYIVICLVMSKILDICTLFQILSMCKRTGIYLRMHLAICAFNISHSYYIVIITHFKFLIYLVLFNYYSIYSLNKLTYCTATGGTPFLYVVIFIV